MSGARGSRWGAIGDVHGEAAHLAVALAALRGMGAERILVVGDIVDGGDDVDACCRLLDAPDVITVRGNHDRWLLHGAGRDLEGATQAAELSPESAAFLTRLQPTARLDTTAGPLLLCHGLGDDDMACLTPDDDGRAIADNRALAAVLSTDVSIVVNGHTHQRMVRSLGAVTVINAGTLARDEHPCFAFVDLDARRVQFHELAGGAHAPGPSFRFGLPGQEVWDAWGGVGVR